MDLIVGTFRSRFELCVGSTIVNKINTVTNRKKIENNRTVTDYRRYSFILNQKQYVRTKITGITGVTVVTVINTNVLCWVLVWCDVRVR